MENNSSSNTEMLPRGGLTFDDYLMDFLHFLKQRTYGFNVNCFETNDELKRTLETLEYYRIPRNIWTAFLNGSVKIFAQFIRMTNFTIKQFVEIIIYVINALVHYAIDYFFLRAALFILGYVTNECHLIIIRTLYYFFIWVGRKIWELVLPKIERYITFATQQLGIVTNVTPVMSN